MKKRKVAVDSGLLVEIDVSGQLSDTKDTVFAFSNGESFSILVPGKTKRIILELYRSSRDRTKDFPLHFYLAGVQILLNSSGKKFTKIVLDREFVGHEKKILKFLTNSLTLFEIRQIGRKSGAHLKAKGVYTKKSKAEKVVKLAELIKFLKLQ